MTRAPAVVVTETYFGTERYDPADPARTFEERRKRCYELAAAAMLFGTAPAGSTLVHGTIDGRTGFGPIGHAWLDLPDGTVWEPITGDVHASRDAWARYASAEVVVTYTLQEARRLVSESEHLGPWHEHDYR